MIEDSKALVQTAGGIIEVPAEVRERNVLPEAMLPPALLDALNRKLLQELLPDSRLSWMNRGKGIVFMAGMYWVPVFCASCSKHYGHVPEENCLFAFWLCDDCAAKWEPLTGTLAMPDEVFWARVALEQLERYGHLLTEADLLKLKAEGTTALGKLLQAGEAGECLST